MTKIEQVARAIDCELIHMFGDHHTGEQLNRLAKAAIQAMREPTEEMVASAWHKESTTDIYQAMIDAALKE